MLRIRFEYETLDYQWKNFQQKNKLVDVVEISSFESDMAFSDNTIDYHSPK